MDAQRESFLLSSRQRNELTSSPSSLSLLAAMSNDRRFVPHQGSYARLEARRAILHDDVSTQFLVYSIFLRSLGSLTRLLSSSRPPRFVDGDLAANNGGWQWVASTGTDPQPYFRIFNPLSQSEKADPSGDYIRSASLPPSLSIISTLS